MNRLNHKYDFEYLKQVVEYGKYIGAREALMINGVLYLYYKRGDKASKFCCYNFDASSEEKIAIGWANSFNTSVERVYEFYVGLGKKCDLILINEINLDGLDEKAQ